MIQNNKKIRNYRNICSLPCSAVKCIRFETERFQDRIPLIATNFSKSF
ncbi:hypothetical protein X975_00715, partial [Stegodyphus mimosarum]